MKLFILSGAFLLCYLPAKASGPAEDSTAREKLVARVAKYISKKCDLDEIQRRKLADRIVIFIDNHRECLDNKTDCSQLKADFKATIIKDFGKRAFKEYRLVLRRIAEMIRTRYWRFR